VPETVAVSLAMGNGPKNGRLQKRNRNRRQPLVTRFRLRLIPEPEKCRLRGRDLNPSQMGRFAWLFGACPTARPMDRACS